MKDSLMALADVAQQLVNKWVTIKQAKRQTRAIHLRLLEMMNSHSHSHSHDDSISWHQPNLSETAVQQLMSLEFDKNPRKASAANPNQHVVMGYLGCHGSFQLNRYLDRGAALSPAVPLRLLLSKTSAAWAPKKTLKHENKSCSSSQKTTWKILIGAEDVPKVSWQPDICPFHS